VLMDEGLGRLGAGALIAISHWAFCFRRSM
jgi:hypothetical protein